MEKPFTKEEFEVKLRDKGRLYHIHHPFQVAMNSGQSSREQIRGWVANRFYYQTTIPVKDAAILANCRDRIIRKEWIQRILDHDGFGSDSGGIEAWLRLAEAVGLSRDEVLSEEHVLPGVRFACDAYINFCRGASWQEAACSSLTELFAPDMSMVRPGWICRYKIEDNGTPRSVEIMDRLENLYYFYEFKYSKRKLQSRYFSSDSTFIGSHTVKFNSKSRPLRIAYYNENGIMKNAVEYEYPKDAKVIISQINSKNKVIQRTLIPKKDN